MKNIFVLTIFVNLFLSSCLTEKRCNEKYPPQISDSVKTWITSECMYDTVYVPYQELIFDTAGVIPPSIVFHHTQNKGGLHQTIDIKAGHISVLCKEDSLKKIIEIQNKTIHEKDSRKEVMTVAIRDGWYNFFKWSFWISFLFCLIFIAGLFLVKDK